MALSITLVSGTDSTARVYDKNLNSIHSAVFKLSLGSSYVTGGIELTAAAITAAVNGTCSAISAVLFGGPSADGVHSGAWEVSSNKILSFTASGTQSSSGADLSATAKDLYVTVFFT